MSEPRLSPSPADTVRPVPPRFWWLKRIAPALAGWIAVLVVARLLWGWDADRRMQAKIAEYRAAGEPILIEDFQRPPIPDDENAAVLYKEAFEKLSGIAPVTVMNIDGTRATVTFADLYWNREWLERYPEEIDRLFEAHAEALRLVREARARPRCGWEPAWASPMASMLPGTTLAPQRELAKAVCSAAWLHHARGHDGEAVERLRDGLAFASRMGDPAQFLIGYLVGAACNGLANRHAASVAPGLRIATDDLGVHSRRGPATHSQVVQLIADLLDERALLRSWDDGILGERILQLDMLENFQTGRQLVGAGAAVPPTRVEAAFGAVLAPARRHLGLEMLAFYGDVRSAGHAALWSQAHSGVDWSWAEQSLHWSNLAIPGGVAGPAGNLEAVLRIHFQYLADRRLAATALAIRLYEVDHGRRPATLDELVPEYLPAVPIDPFAADGGPIRYLPDGTPPRLYSIGEDGVDDGAPMRQATRGGWWSWRADIVVTLESPLATTATRPASEQAPDDEPGVEQGAAEQQGQ